MWSELSLVPEVSAVGAGWLRNFAPSNWLFPQHLFYFSLSDKCLSRPGDTGAVHRI